MGRTMTICDVRFPGSGVLCPPHPWELGNRGFPVPCGSRELGNLGTLQRRSPPSTRRGTIERLAAFEALGNGNSWPLPPPISSAVCPRSRGRTTGSSRPANRVGARNSNPPLAWG